jgi:hypothetical protein
MTFIALCILLYFLPALLGRNKRHAGAIFLFNFFLGWTVIGWLVALIWACTTDDPQPVMVIAGGAGVHHCSRCGKPQFAAVSYCSGCGSRM